jgi:hypothetical protein
MALLTLLFFAVDRRIGSSKERLVSAAGANLAKSSLRIFIHCFVVMLRTKEFLLELISRPP